MYTARVVNTLSSARVRCTFRCDTANYLLEPFVRFPVIRSSRIPLIPMQSAVKCAALHGTVAAPGPSQPLRFCLSTATHFRCKCSSIGNANTEMVAVATLPHPAATHLFTITLDNNQTSPNRNAKTSPSASTRCFTASSRSVPVHTSRYYVISLPRLGRSRYIRHGITSFHCLVSSVPVHTSRYYVISLPHLGRSRYIRHGITSFHCLVSLVPVHTSRYYVILLPRLGRSRYIRHDITSFHCLVSVGPGTYVTVLRNFTASSRWSRYIRHDITSFYCLVSVGPGTYVTILRHFTASSRRSRYIRHGITSFHCLVSVGSGTYVTILRHFTARYFALCGRESRHVVQTSHLYLLS